MIITRGDQVAAYLRQRKSIGIKDRKRRVPAQSHPILIERKYGRELLTFMRATRTELAELLNELPQIIASALAERRFDAARFDAARFDAGETARVRQLIREARGRMTNRIASDVDNLAERFGRETERFNKIQLNRQTRAALGADVFIQDRRLPALLEAFVNSNVGEITKLSDETAGRVETTIMRGIQGAKPYNELAEELQAQFDFSEKRAILVARDQVGKFYGQTNAARQRELGVSHFIWRTSGDERVSGDPSGKYPDADPSHYDLDGKRFAYDDPPNAGRQGEPALPGEPINCRCNAEPDFSDILASV